LVLWFNGNDRPFQGGFFLFITGKGGIIHTFAAILSERL